MNESDEYWRGYKAGLADQSGSGVLQAVLDAIKGTLDPHSQIADHPNVKFAQMQMLALRGVGVEAGAHQESATPETPMNADEPRENAKNLAGAHGGVGTPQQPVLYVQTANGRFRELERTGRAWRETMPDGTTRYNCDCLNADPKTGAPSDEQDAIYCERWVYLAPVGVGTPQERELEALKVELEQFKSSRQRVRDSFGHRDGECQCVYCRRDAEGLAEHAADYEMRWAHATERVAALNAEVVQLRELISNALAALAGTLHQEEKADQ